MSLLAPTATEFLPVDGWELEVRRYGGSGRPLVMIPGYAMNTHVLAYHPRGVSMVEHLVSRGFDVWTANLRGQGASRRTGPTRRFGIGELVLTDLPAVLDRVRSATGAQSVDAIGCSLGGSLLYAWLAHHPVDHGLRSAVAIGAPLRWGTVNPLLRVAFRSGRLAGAVPIVGTRRLASKFLPLLRRVPSVLSMYMNPGNVDLDAIDSLIQTVDDPVPWINRQLARWLAQRDLVVRGVNVTTGLGAAKVRLLAILANRDGIVPPSVARSVERAFPEATVLVVGDDVHWYAHADMFVGNTAVTDVFEPLATWLHGSNPLE